MWWRIVGNERPFILNEPLVYLDQIKKTINLLSAKFLHCYYLVLESRILIVVKNYFYL